MSYYLIINYIYFIFLRNKIKNKKHDSYLIILFSLLIFIFIAFRYEVGGDWNSYLLNYINQRRLGLFEGLKDFPNIPFIISFYVKNFTLINESIVLGTIFSFLYCRYLKSTDNFFLSLFITFPVMLILAGMGYVNQGVAIIICWQIFINYKEKSNLEIITYIGFACLFHISALIFFLFLIPKNKSLLINIVNNYLSIIIPISLIIFGIIFLFQMDFFFDFFNHFEKKFYSYLYHDYYKSYGTGFRLLLFAPSLLIVSYVSLKFLDNSTNLNLIRITIGIIFFLILFTIILKGSILYAFLDRILLYFIFFLVIICNAYYSQYNLKDNILVDISVYLFPTIYLFVWINFSEFSPWWIPYKNVLFLNNF